ncbi:MAG: hypothetical protein AAF363_22280 [Bacteroidota bacterium]
MKHILFIFTLTSLFSIKVYAQEEAIELESKGKLLGRFVEDDTVFVHSGKLTKRVEQLEFRLNQRNIEIDSWMIQLKRGGNDIISREGTNKDLLFNKLKTRTQPFDDLLITLRGTRNSKKFTRKFTLHIM